MARGGRRPARPRRIPDPRRRLLLVPHRAGRRAARRRPRARDAVRHVLQPQHHAGSRDRDRPLERGRLPPCAAQRHAARRRQLFPGIPLSELQRDHRRRSGGDARLSVVAAGGAAAQHAARRRFPVFLALPPARLEAAVLPLRPVHARSAPERRAQPRRLPRHRPRPLRRVPHAAQRLRRPHARSAPGRHARRAGQHAGAQHHARQDHGHR